MKTIEVWIGPKTDTIHEVEIDRHTLAAFWRLGCVLASGTPRDREIFALGRCIGSTPGITATLHAYSDREDPASFAISKLMYGGDQPMVDAYWNPPEDPAVFQLAREVHRRCPAGVETAADFPEGGLVVFDVSGDRARLAGLRFQTTA